MKRKIDLVGLILYLVFLICMIAALIVAIHSQVLWIAIFMSIVVIGLLAKARYFIFEK